MTQRHLPCLTALRGIAAICVLLHHFTGFLLPATGAALADGTAFFRRSYLCVDFFFVLSGFLLAHLYQGRVGCADRARTYRAFLRARLARIYPLHLATLLAMLGLNVVMVAAEVRTAGLAALWSDDRLHALRFYGNDTVFGLLRHAVLLQTLNAGAYTDWNGPAWSIGAEWIAYLLFPVLVAPVVLAPRIGAVAVAPLALGGVAALGASHGGSLDLAGLPGTVRCLLEFVLGIALLQWCRAGIAAGALRCDAALAIALAAAAAALHWEVADALAVPAFGLVVLAAASNGGKASRWLETRPALWLGGISYAVYMLHWPLLVGWRWAWRAAFGAEFGASLTMPVAAAALAAATAVVLIAADFTWRRFEVPWRRRLRGD